MMHSDDECAEGKVVCMTANPEGYLVSIASAEGRVRSVFLLKEHVPDPTEIVGQHITIVYNRVGMVLEVKCS